jgi:hypothetical protein
MREASGTASRSSSRYLPWNCAAGLALNPVIFRPRQARYQTLRDRIS